MLLLLAACFLPKDTDTAGTVDSCGCTDSTATYGDTGDGDGYTPSDGDCDDTNPDVNPGATETCNGVDDNCDGQIDEGVTSTWYTDADGDGFGNATSVEACSAPAGFVANSADCNDGDPYVFPGNTETCNGGDDNCDGVIDEGVTTRYYADADADGCGDPASFADTCTSPANYVSNADDRDDTNATVCL